MYLRLLLNFAAVLSELISCFAAEACVANSGLTLGNTLETLIANDQIITTD